MYVVFHGYLKLCTLISILLVYDAFFHGVLQYARWQAVRDITDYWQEWLVNLVLVAVWLVLTFTLHFPGCPKYVLCFCFMLIELYKCLLHAKSFAFTRFVKS